MPEHNRRRKTINLEPGLSVMAVLFFFCPIAVAATPQNTTDVLVLKQFHRSGGEQILYLSSSSIKIVQPGTRSVTLATAPKWQVTVINNSSHTYCLTKSSSSQGLLVQRAMLLEGVDLSRVKWRIARRQQIAGLDAALYVDSAVSDKQRAREGGFQDLGKELRYRGFWVAENLNISKEAADQIAGISGLPLTGKVPLRFIHLTLMGHHEVAILDTLKSYKEKIPVNDMSIPKGYTLSKTEFDGLGEELDELIPRSSQKAK